MPVSRGKWTVKLGDEIPLPRGRWAIKLLIPGRWAVKLPVPGGRWTVKLSVWGWHIFSCSVTKFLLRWHWVIKLLTISSLETIKINHS